MDEIDALLNKVNAQPSAKPTAPAPAASTAPASTGDDIDAVLRAVQPQAAPAPTPAAAPAPGDEIDQVLMQFKPPAVSQGIADDVGPMAQPAPTRPGYLEALTRGARRGVAGLHADAYYLKGLGQEIAGAEGADIAKSFAEGEAIERAAPQPIVPTFDEVHNVDDFMTYAIERLGEQAPILASMFTGAGTGVAVARVVGKGLLRSAAKRAALARAGGFVGGAGAGMAIETGQTASEQFGATGSAQPATSLAAGAAKGALEFWGPYSIIRGLRDPAVSIGGALVKGALREGMTEAAQEAVDLTARELNDPNYQFLSRESYIRVREAALAGTIVGGTYGGAGKAVAKAAGLDAGQARGDQAKVTPEELDELDAEMKFEEPRSWDNPLKWLRDKFMRRRPASPDSGVPEADQYDFSEMSAINDGVRKTWDAMELQDEQLTQVREFEDAQTPRYVLPGATPGKFSNRVLNSTDLEEELSKLPQDQKPEVVKVDHRSFQAGHITADVFDLPDATDPRVFTLPGTTPEEQMGLMRGYVALKVELEGGRDRAMTDPAFRPAFRAQLETMYNDLISKGLRVVPSYGASFYYNGIGRGETVSELPASGRTQLREGPYAHTSVVDQLEPVAKPGTFVGIDANRLRFGDGFALPSTARNGTLTMEDVWFSDAVQEGEREALLNELEDAKADYTKVQELFNRGIAYRPTSKWVFSYIHLNPGNIAKAKTPGTNLGTMYTSQLGGSTKLRRYVPQAGELVENRSTQKDTSQIITPGEVSVVGTVDPRMVTYAKKYTPKLKALNRKLGITDDVVVVVVPSSKYTAYNPYYDPMAHAIIVPDMFAGDNTIRSAIDAKGVMTDEEVFVNALMHEYGHMVTMVAWEKLPLALQTKIYNAYRRSLASFATAGSSVAMSRITLPGSDKNLSYHATFVEWLAEQFRRWSTYGGMPLNESEKFEVSAGFNIKKIENELAHIFGDTMARNMVAPSWEFASIIEYLEATAAESDRPLYLVEKSQPLWHNQVNIPPELEPVFAETNKALREFAATIPPGTVIDVRPEVQDGILAEYVSISSTLRIWAGSLALRNKPDLVRRAVVHEAAHANWNLFKSAEKAVLVRKAREAKVLSPQEVSIYKRLYAKMGREMGIAPEAMRDFVRAQMAKEYFATLLDSRRNGQVFDERTNSILDAVWKFIEKVMNFLDGAGFRTADDLIAAFYRGEIAARSDAAARVEFWDNRAMKAAMADVQAMGQRSKYMTPDRVVRMPNGMWMTVEKFPEAGAASYRVFTGPPRLTGRDVIEQLDQLGEEVGSVNLDFVKGKGWEVAQVYVSDKFRRRGIASMMYDYWQKDLKTVAKPSGTLQPDGYAMWKAREPESVRYHVFDPVTEMWYSPNKLREQHAFWTRWHDRAKKGDKTFTVLGTKGNVERYKSLMDKVDPRAWDDPMLKKAFMIDGGKPFKGVFEKEYYLREIGKALDRDENKLIKAVTGESEGPTVDDFTRAHLEKHSDYRRNGQVAPQPETANLHGLIRVFRRGEQDPETNRILTGVSTENDKISWFSKLFFGLHQVAWRNLHIPEIRNYLNLMEQMNTYRMGWVTRADDISRRWDKLDETQRTGLADLLFYLTEMNYRTRQEVTNGVTRLPTQAELTAAIQRFGLQADGAAVFVDVRRMFESFLSESEQIAADTIRRTFSDPATVQLKLNELAADMAALRAKPYFPMVRFGEWTITARDPQNGNAVEWFSAHATERERDAALRELYRRHGRAYDYSIGRVPQEAQEFMGLPPPVLRAIKAGLPGITAQQSDWIDQFMHMNAPDRSFRKRWLARRGTPGYSLDAFRVFAHYFLSGANYLSRLRFKEPLQEQITSLRTGLPLVRDSRKRVQLIDMLQEHMKYVLEGGKDWVRLKSLVSLWQLGFSPAAAGINLTQTMTTTWPYLSKIFGSGPATRYILSATNALKNSFDYVPDTDSDAFKAVRQELVRQGKIDVGQAPELGAYADGFSLTSLNAGTQVQRYYRQTVAWGMAMFGKAERINREIVLAATWELALRDPNNKHLQQLDQWNQGEIARLLAQTFDVGGRQVRLTYDQALALIAARHAIDRTQLLFQPWARPKFLRPPAASMFLVYFGYMQGMLYAFGNNPGAARMFLVSAFLFGMMGLPGAEDLDEVLKAIARKMFGADFSLEDEARKLVREITRGTVFDQTGPDLFMHGISKFSFGLGLLQEGYGIPQFDASANGSMGRIIPGLADTARAVGNDSTWQEVTANMAKDASGAGFGQLFPMLQFLGSDPFTTDLKKWEKAMPRFGKGLSKAYRYYTEEQERALNGATIARFNPRDPDDLATIAAQAFGFSPTRVTDRYKFEGEMFDKQQWYKSRRLALMAQVDEAVRVKDKELVAKQIARVRRYNQDVARNGLPTLGITSDQLSQSLKGRATSRARREAELPPQNMFIPLQRKVQDLYPGSVIDQKVEKVK